jgi:ATP-dependent DNA ligase
MPPVRPMLAKAVERFPEGDLSFEPKWDGFRCIVFRDGDEIVLGSRNTKPLDRYFPELLDELRRRLPRRCVIDGEIVVVTGDRLDFDALGQRIHPADSRVRLLAERTPATFVAFDALATDRLDLRGEPFARRRDVLVELLDGVGGLLQRCPATVDPDVARDWYDRFEGAGLDGLIAKPRTGRYEEDRRVLFKVKYHRTADCVVAGFRTHKDGAGVGSLLLGLYDGAGTLHHLGVAAGLSAKRREEFARLLAPLVDGALDDHPWAGWATPEAHADGRLPGAPSRWNGAKDLSWVPVHLERVAEVGYVTVTNGRFRGVASFVRWRDDRDPASCRYDQLVEADPLGVSAVLGSG